MASKQVKKTHKKDLYFYIFEFVKNNKALPTKEFSKQKLNYYVRELKKADLIRSTGYATWEISGEYEDFKKYKQVKKVNYDGKKTRGHGFVFQILLKPIENWDQRDIYLRENFIPFEKIRQGQSIKLRGHTIWLCNKSIVVYFSPRSSFYATDSYSSSGRALIECKETLKVLEKSLRVDLKYGKGWFIREAKSHYADINNCLAKYYRTKGVNQFNIEQNGKTWALVDNSFNLLELETIAGNGESKGDLPKLQMFLNDLRDNPTTITATKEELTGLILNLAKRTDEIQQQLQAQVMLTNKLTEIVIEKFK